MNSHTEEQYLQSAKCRLKTQAVCKTFQPNENTFNANVAICQRKYPVANTKELSGNNTNYVAMNKKLDCFGSVEPHNDVSKSSELFKNFNIPFSEKDFSLFTSHFSLKHSHLMRGEVHKSSRKVAFTLAEVLITLGIIGVVAAITLPILHSKYEREANVTKLHKTYNEFSQAFLRFKNENGEWLTESGYEKGDDMMPFMKKYFKVIKDCGTEPTGCFADSYVNIRGLNFKIAAHDNIETHYGVLANGVSFGIFNLGSWPGYGNLNNPAYIGIYVDINGKKRPNVYGRDFFAMYVFPDAVIDDWQVTVNCRRNNICSAGTTSPVEMRNHNYGAAGCLFNRGGNYTCACLGKIINDGWKMNY